MSREARHLTLSSILRQLTLLILFAAPGLAQPRVFLYIVVDQCPITHLDPDEPFTDGLKRLRDTGVYFTQAYYHQIPTETEPGHATLMTGCSPAEHGLIGDEWFDRETNTMRPALRDPYTNQRSIAALLKPTVGDLLKQANERSIVISLAGKSAPALIMGGQNPNLMAWYNPYARRFSTSSQYSKLPRWLRLMKASRFFPSGKSDRLISEAAQIAIDKLGVGKDDVPDLVAIGFSASDQLGHRFGSTSSIVGRLLHDLDHTIGDLLRFCDEKFGTDGYAVVFTSDHGVMPLPESAIGLQQGFKRISKTKLREKIESALQNAFPSKTKLVLKMSLPNIYLDRSAINSMERAADVIKAVPGVAGAYAPPFKNSADPYTNIYQRSYYPDRSGDVMVRLYGNTLARHIWEGAGHGSPYSYDAHVPLIFFNPKITPKRVNTPVQMTDVAATVFDILKLPKPPVLEGKTLMKVIKK